MGNNLRFTVVPRTVFLNSGTLDLTHLCRSSTTGVPVLGTLPLNAVNQPAQQNTSGVGGEFQVAGSRFAAAVGYTPYEFLVQNITGRGLFLPNRHVTLYFNRDSVVETQLSYAGLRDPGSATAVYGGNIWGGVISTGGGVRFNMGDAKAGFYITADGADLTGYHVLENNKFEGSAGAYFLAHSVPGYGRLNIGASAFGMHYAHNERGLSYGLGGYFSPTMPTSWLRFRSPLPATIRNDFHYTIAGSVGVQTFQEEDQVSSRWTAVCRRLSPPQRTAACHARRRNWRRTPVRSIRTTRVRVATTQSTPRERTGSRITGLRVGSSRRTTRITTTR